MNTDENKYKVDSDINFNFIIKNSGTKLIENFDVSVYVDGKRIGSNNYSMVALSSGTVHFKMTFPTAKSYNVEARLDDNKNIPESDESDRDNNKNIIINVKPLYEHHWFSQISADVGAKYNVTNFEKLFFPNYISNNIDNTEKAKNTPFYYNKYASGQLKPYINPYLDPKENVWFDSGLIQRWGCVASSLAMILKNLGLRTTSKYYDIRTNTTNYLDPDPFTVIMANCNFPNITSKQVERIDNNQIDKIYEISLAKNALFIYSSTVCGYFNNYSVERTKLDNCTPKQKAIIITQKSTEHPEGVIVKMGHHVLVFISSTYNITAKNNSTFKNNFKSIILTPEIEKKDYEKYDFLIDENFVKKVANGTNYEQYFKVYDPATQCSSAGESVLLTNSYSYTKLGLDLSNATYIDALKKINR